MKFQGISAALTAIAGVFRNLRVFLKIALLWSLIHVAILVAYSSYIALTRHVNLLAGLQFLKSLPGLQVEYFLTAIPNILSSLAVTILWIRFVVEGTRPSAWIQVPTGSARYVARSLAIGFGAILGLVPGLILARVLSGFLPDRFAAFGAAAIIGIDALAVLYVCLRFWLVFPAIAVGDASIGFARSFALMKGITLRLLLGSMIPYFCFFAWSSSSNLRWTFGRRQARLALRPL